MYVVVVVLMPVLTSMVILVLVLMLVLVLLPMVVAIPVRMALFVVMIVPVTLVVAVVMVAAMRVSRRMQIKARKGRRDHGRIEMATLTCIDLDGGGPGRADPFCIVGGLLVTLDDGQRGDGRPLVKRVDGCAQQGGFPGSGA